MATRTIRVSQGVGLRWLEADNWADAEIPLDALSETYRISIIGSDGDLIRQVTSLIPEYVYLAEDIQSDFGSSPVQFEFRAAQIGDSGMSGSAAAIAVNAS